MFVWPAQCEYQVKDTWSINTFSKILIYFISKFLIGSVIKSGYVETQSLAVGGKISQKGMATTQYSGKFNWTEELVG